MMCKNETWDGRPSCVGMAAQRHVNRLTVRIYVERIQKQPAP
ncbi:hypothetical protein [Kingella denitrificans]|nr:hypothetical protein [Kingella denitrificans]